MRIALAALCAIAIASAAVFIASSEKTITAAHTTWRDFDVRARDTTNALGELRLAQAAYVASGQGTDAWISKVDATSQTLAGTLGALQQSAVSLGAKTAAAEAKTAFEEFGDVDRRIRGYLTSGSQLMAADIVFTEGGEAAAAAARAVEKARLEERAALDGADATRRSRELAAAAATAAVMMLSLIVLAVKPRRVAEATGLSLTVAAESPVTTWGRPDTDLDIRRDDASIDPPATPPPPPAPTVPVTPTAIAPARNVETLKAAAQLCTDIGRVADVEELRTLVGRAAELLNASGLILWLADDSSPDLRPAVAHGYSQETVQRIPAVPRTAENAAAAAFRSGALQIVLSRPGSSSKGAIVAPVLSTDGCIGVLAVEVRDGAEASETIQALAAIVAAQLGGVVAVAPPQADSRVSSGGRM